MNLFFDLDGTLMDPREGITKSLNYALRKFNLPPREPSYLERFIGPSLNEAFRVLLETDDRTTLARAVVWYRERYFTEGWLEYKVYAGTPELLHTCCEAGHRLFVATTKRQDIATRVLTHFGLASYFTAIYGCDVDLTKTDLLTIMLEEQSLSAASCLMIGDRWLDVEAGRANGVATVGVLWGYGTPEELMAAAADHLVMTPPELLNVIDGVDACNDPGDVDVKH